MKKFLIKVLSFTIIIAVITAVLNCLFIRLDKSDLDYTNKYKDMPETIMICNFGSSHGQYDFNYEELGDNCFNFALPSQMPSYDLRLFEYYKDRFADGAVAFIPISYFSLFGIDETQDDGFIKKNKRYYRILPAKSIKEYDIKTDIYVRYLPAIAAGEDFFRTLIGGSEEEKDLRWYTNVVGKDISEDTNTMISRQILNYALNEEGEIIFNTEEIDAVKQLIEECRKNNVTPILVTTPFLHDYTDRIREIDPEFFDVFHDTVNSIVSETGVEYYDYSFDERFTDNREWFFNCDHLNNVGAREFVRILMDDCSK
ncbi:MAG: hypothetical protein IKE53_09355 [Clostridiales bacterium]|nr:hypothetical protein [Clostridiales bacterium]